MIKLFDHGCAEDIWRKTAVLLISRTGERHKNKLHKS